MGTKQYELHRDRRGRFSTPSEQGINTPLVPTLVTDFRP